MYGMCNICNIRLPQNMGDVIASIGIGTAAADSIGYRAPARYRSNPSIVTVSEYLLLDILKTAVVCDLSICAFVKLLHILKTVYV